MFEYQLEAGESSRRSAVEIKEGPSLIVGTGEIGLGASSRGGGGGDDGDEHDGGAEV